MAVYLDIKDLPKFRNAVLTIGTFDGVHEGHETILKEVVKHAKEANGESVLITFEPHPRKLLFPDQPLKLLTPLHQKLQYITEAGIEHIVVAPFTREFANLSAEEYIAHFLVMYFHPHCIIIGYDHRFGHDRKGDINLLKEYAAAYGYRVLEIPAQLIDDAAVSSTKIRKALNEGRMQDATHMLGRPYSIKGTVKKGAQLGRTIGYPTANIQPDDPEQLIPANGIYAVRVKYKDKSYGGMMSIGYNPTVTDDQSLKLEVNIFDFNEDVYGQPLEISFIAWLRNEEKFDSLEALTEQLHRDKDNTIQALQA